MATQRFADLGEGLRLLEQRAREVVDQATEERLEKAPTEFARDFLGELRDLWRPATTASEWDEGQAEAFGRQARRFHIAFMAGGEASTRAWNPPEDEPPPPEEEMMPSGDVCIGRCVTNALECLRNCRDEEWPWVCEAICLGAFDWCLYQCIPPFE